jgi:tetratricopeptide (TPR) repeat protein
MPEHIEFSLVPGELVVGRYRITRMIGRGGMGEVYEAHDQLLREAIALKTLRGDLAIAEAITKRFRKEIQLARKITHPNVCRVFETGMHERAGTGQPPLPFFTMELLSGETLSARISRLKRMSWAAAAPIAVQMAEGLQAAHEAGIVHADFKSGNVILMPGPLQERAVITDFGLALIDPSTAPPDQTRSMLPEGRIAGTMAYMSPEQLAGGTVTAASDIYSFGIVLFEMATGTLPFDAGHAVQAAVQRVSGESITAKSLVPNVDSRWDTAIGRCLQRDPEHRFRSARDLAGFLTGSGWRTSPRYWTRRQWIGAGAITGVPVLAVGAYWTWSHRPYLPTTAALDWYQKGEASLHSMTYEAARRAFEQSVAADPGFAVAHASLARAYEELDYSDRARQSMLRALTLAGESRPSKQEALKIRASQLLVSRDYDRAIPVFQQLEAAANQNEKPAAALESGWLAQQRDDTVGAANAYERALKMDPRYAAAKLRLGYILGRRRKLDDALKAFQDAEDLYDASSNYEGVTETLYQRAMLLNRSSRSAEAMAVIEKALVVAGAVGNPYQKIRLQSAQGVAFRNLGDTVRASTLAQQSIDAAIAQRMDNLAAGFLVDLGNAFLIRGDHASAEPNYRKALDLAERGKVRRSEARARLALGALCEQDHRLTEARQLLESVLPFYRQAGYRRELVQATAVLGGVLQQRAEFDEGIRVLREALPQAIQLQDKQAEAEVRERLAENLRDQGAWPEALAEFERTASLWGSRGAGARLNCAELYSRLGRPQDAETSLSDTEKLLRQTSDEQRLLDLWITRTWMAYLNGRFSVAQTWIRRATGRSDPRVYLLETLIRIRTKGDVDPGLAAVAIQSFEKAGLLLGAAAARLAIAEAWVVAAKPNPAVTAAAWKLAQEAAEFFEPRHIWESLWRVHWVASRAAPSPALAQTHGGAARDTLTKLATIWTSTNMEGYLRRPDINLLASDMKR